MTTDEVRGQAASKLNLENMLAGLVRNTDGLTKLRIGSVSTYPGGPYRLWYKIADPVVEAMAEVTNGTRLWPMVLLGNAGVGKTCAAMCLLDFVRGGRKYWTVADLCLELIAVQNGEVEYGMHPDTPREWWKRYAELECVVVDELVARDKVSDFGYETVKRAIDLRYGKPLVVASNGSIETISKLYDDRIASRLAGGTVIEMVGEDRRLEASP